MSFILSRPVPEPIEVDHHRADALVEALSRSLSALSTSRLEAAASVVQAARARQSLSTSFSRADITGLPQTVLVHCAALRDETMGIEERLIVLGEIDHGKAVLLAQAGLIRADDVILSAAFKSDAQEFTETWQTLADHISQDRQQTIDDALSLCSFQRELDNGVSNACDVAKVQTLIDLGADVHAGDLWVDVVANGDSDIHVAFLKAGADLAPYLEKVNNDRYSYNYLGAILKELSGTALYMRLDDHTLVQTLFLPPFDLSNRLTTMYRFDLARITETQQDGNNKFPPQSIHFSDVPLETLTAMRDRLVKMGGAPLNLTSILRNSHASPIVKLPSSSR